MDVNTVALSKRYGEKVVLSSLTLSFKAGALHAIVGDNGAGKSTLASILSGSIEADSGFITLDGRMVCLKSVKDAKRHGIVCVKQRPPIAAFLTVKSNILVGAEIARKGVPKKELAAEIDALCKEWCPSLDINAYGWQITPQQRVFASIAAALLCRPKVLILDESTALLNSDEERALYANIKALSRSGMNVIIITHHTDEASKECGTITHLPDINNRRRLSIPLDGQAAPIADSRAAKQGKLTLITGDEGALAAMEETVLGNAAYWRGKGRAIIPTDRTYRGSDPDLTVAQVICAARRGRVDMEYAKRLIAKAGVNTEPLSLAKSLSGGMLQRIILARELDAHPSAIIAFNPLHGLDELSKASTVEALCNAAKSGGSVTVVSLAPFPQEKADKAVRV